MWVFSNHTVFCLKSAFKICLFFTWVMPCGTPNSHFCCQLESTQEWRRALGTNLQLKLYFQLCLLIACLVAILAFTRLFCSPHPSQQCRLSWKCVNACCCNFLLGCSLCEHWTACMFMWCGCSMDLMGYHADAVQVALHITLTAWSGLSWNCLYIGTCWL